MASPRSQSLLVAKRNTKERTPDAPCGPPSVTSGTTSLPRPQGCGRCSGEDSELRLMDRSFLRGCSLDQLGKEWVEAGGTEGKVELCCIVYTGLSDPMLEWEGYENGPGLHWSIPVSICPWLWAAMGVV